MRPRPQLRLLTGIFAAVLAIALGACGSSGPENGLTQDQANKLVSALENLNGDVSSGACEEAGTKLGTIREDIAAIAAEDNVDEEIIAGLEELADQTEALLQDCTEQTDTTTDESTSSSTTTTETSTTSTEDTDTTSTDEETTPTDEEPEETTPPEEEPPAEPPSDNAPPGPEGNPNDEGSFDGSGGVSPREEKKKGASKPAKDKPAKPGKDKKRMMGGAASPPADQEMETR